MEKMLWKKQASSISALRKRRSFFRELPHNIEAEQALLGALLINNDALDRVSDFLKPEHFFEPLHQKIYDVVSHLIKNGKLANPVTIKPFIPAEEKLEILLYLIMLFV